MDRQNTLDQIIHTWLEKRHFWLRHQVKSPGPPIVSVKNSEISIDPALPQSIRSGKHLQATSSQL